MVLILRIAAVAAALALLCCMSGCANSESGLKKRAAEYYSYMLGLTPKLSYSSFLTPAYRKTFTKAGLKELNAKLAVAEANKRYKPAQAKHVAVLIKGRFGYSNIGNELGQSYADIGPVRWVRVGSRWYVHMSTNAELSAYGPFPSDVSPPAPPLPEAKAAQ